MTHWRLTVDVLLPPGQHPRGCPVNQATAAQHPISDWLDMSEWFRVKAHVAAARPVHKLGLVYGYQERKTDAPGHAPTFFADLASLVDDRVAAMAYIDAEASRRDAAYADAIRRVDEFVAGFDFAAYGLAAGLDILATAVGSGRPT